MAVTTSTFESVTMRNEESIGTVNINSPYRICNKIPCVHSVSQSVYLSVYIEIIWTLSCCIKGYIVYVDIIMQVLAYRFSL